MSYSPVLIFILFIAVTGCSSHPKKPEQYHRFLQPSVLVEQAALDAMAVSGFLVTSHSPELLQGYRPRVFGSTTCNPGGETAAIWLQETSPTTTLVWAATNKTSFGFICQKDWSADLLQEIESSFGKE